MILQGNLRRSEFENFDKFLVLMKNSLFQRRELTIHFPQEKFTDEVELTITRKSSLQKTNHLFSLAPIAAEILFVFHSVLVMAKQKDCSGERDRLSEKKLLCCSSIFKVFSAKYFVYIRNKFIYCDTLKSEQYGENESAV